jgi:hypothetical protein
MPARAPPPSVPRSGNWAFTRSRGMRYRPRSRGCRPREAYGSACHAHGPATVGIDHLPVPGSNPCPGLGQSLSCRMGKPCLVPDPGSRPARNRGAFAGNVRSLSMSSRLRIALSFGGATPRTIGPHTRHAANRAAGRTRPLSLEALEDRLAPATLTVNSTADTADRPPRSAVRGVRPRSDDPLLPHDHLLPRVRRLPRGRSRPHSWISWQNRRRFRIYPLREPSGLTWRSARVA